MSLSSEPHTCSGPACQDTWLQNLCHSVTVAYCRARAPLDKWPSKMGSFCLPQCSWQLELSCLVTSWSLPCPCSLVASLKNVCADCILIVYVMSRCFQAYPPDFLHIASPDADFISSVHLKNSDFISKVSIMKCWSRGCVSCSKALLAQPSAFHHMSLAGGDFQFKLLQRGQSCHDV